MTKKIQLKKEKNITKTTIKKLLKDENTIVICTGSFTDDFLADKLENFHRDEQVSREWFEVVGLSCLTFIFQPRFRQNGYNKRSFDVKLGQDVYVIKNNNIEWI